MALTYTLLYFGNFADIDPTETNGISENAAALLGTYGTALDPLYGSQVDATANDANADNTLADDDNGATPETLTIGSTAYALDSLQVYNATVTFVDGTTGLFTAVVIQLANGDVYMAPEYTAGPDVTLLQSKLIESITLDSVNSDDSGMVADRIDMSWDGPTVTVDGTSAAENMGIGYYDTDGDSIDGADGFTDIIFGGGGDDTIFAGLSDDTIDAGNDNDTVYGGQGNDSLDGGSGNDILYGGTGDDSIQGGDGFDQIFGGVGADTIDAGDGGGSVEGGSGDDIITTGVDNDFIYGGAGFDVITTSKGDDILFSGDSANIDEDFGDSLFAGGGSDILYAGRGDYVDGGATGTDLDTLYVQGGIDSIIYSGGANEAGTVYYKDGNTLTFTEIEDVQWSPDLSDGTVNGTFFSDVYVPGYADDQGDSIDGNDGDNDIIDMGGGPDIAYAGQGNDTVYGGNDFFGDLLFGGNGNDYLVGGSGDDYLYGDEGTDSIYGGSGNDTMFGGSATVDNQAGDGSTGDVLYGGDGNDRIGAGGGDRVYGGEGFESGYGDRLSVFESKENLDSIVYTSADDGTIYFKDGTQLYFEDIERIIFVCFADGTGIETDKGRVLVENLRVGDQVMTRDNGLQKIRWIGSRKVKAEGEMAPICITKGALGNARDLMVSPQHRMLIEGWQAELLFGEGEVLAAAKDLINGDTIYRRPGGEVEYFHILFDSHEIIYAEDAPSESFHPGQQSMSVLEEEVRDEIYELFPALRKDLSEFGPAARFSLRSFEAEMLAKTMWMEAA